MVKYRVPEQYKHGFKVLSVLSDDQVKDFCEEINSAINAYSIDSFVVALKDKVTISYEDLRSLISTTFSLAGFIVDGQVSIQELAVDMADSYEAFDDEERERFKVNLITIISQSPRIKLIIKARRLINDYDKVFNESWILSDVRFVLGDDIQHKSQSAVIVHQLKVDYIQDGEIKQVFFAMDVNDLQQLKVSIERALEKETHIRSKHYFDNLNFLELSN